MRISMAIARTIHPRNDGASFRRQPRNFNPSPTSLGLGKSFHRHASPLKTRQVIFLHGMNSHRGMIGKSSVGVFRGVAGQITKLSLPDYDAPSPPEGFGQRGLRYNWDIIRNRLPIWHHADPRGNILVGHSMGGWFALKTLAYALAHKEFEEGAGRVDAVILINSGPPAGVIRPHQVWDNKHLWRFLPYIFYNGLLQKPWHLSRKMAFQYVLNDPKRTGVSREKIFKALGFESGRMLWELAAVPFPAHQREAKIEFPIKINRPVALIHSRYDRIIHPIAMARFHDFLQANSEEPHWIETFEAQTDHHFFGSDEAHRVLQRARDWLQSKL